MRPRSCSFPPTHPFLPSPPPQARTALREALELPFRLAALVAGAPLRLRTGLLLYGPPGCGKTHVVAAAAAAMAEGVSMR